MSNINVRTNSGDVYETPEELTEEILKKEKFEGIVLEPCCASGRMSKVIEKYGYKVISSDIRTEDIYGKNESDFLNYSGVVDNIMTNPPYSIATKIIEHALEHYSKKIIVLVRDQYLNGIGRKELYEKYPPKRVYAISKRPTLYPAGQEKPKNPGQIDYIWIVWEKNYKGITELCWI
jgi:hypothetical protein